MAGGLVDWNECLLAAPKVELCCPRWRIWRWTSLTHSDADGHGHQAIVEPIRQVRADVMERMATAISGAPSRSGPAMSRSRLAAAGQDSRANGGGQKYLTLAGSSDC
jgi:hypothetical protein